MRAVTSRPRTFPELGATCQSCDAFTEDDIRVQGERAVRALSRAVRRHVVQTGHAVSLERSLHTASIVRRAG